MRGLLIFLAIAFPIVLASPTFWWLVESEVGAAPVGYGRVDGSVQQALLGPKAPWPEWVSTPEGAKLTVRAWFGPAPSEIESGFGDLSFGGDTQKVIDAYRAKLRSEGWNVEGSFFSAPLPEIPPRQMEACILRATRNGADTRIIQASFEFKPGPGYGSVHWAMAPMPTWSTPGSEPC